MSEPIERATRIDAIARGVLHWTVHDDRIGSRSEAYAVGAGAGRVLVDPLPLAERTLRSLGEISAVVITIQSHQRSAWRHRARSGATVHAPRGAEGLEEEPDAWYGEGDRLPGGLRAIHAPGPCDASYALVLDGPPRVLFIGDLLWRGARGPLRFIPREYQDDARRTRASVRKLARLEVALVCPGHGAPIRRGGTRALASALARDDGA